MSIFQLQQFAVKQTISGMKICSDSLLFGAIIPTAKAKKILDIGTGTGILALMLAQKANAEGADQLHSITAVELTQEAAKEAQENVDNSPWAGQIKIIQQDIQQFSQNHAQQQLPRYDLIISNPPFFVDQAKTSAVNPLRHTARHSDTLSFKDLCQSLDYLLTETGNVYLLLPIISISQFCYEAARIGLKLVSQVDIAESKQHPVKVSVLHFNKAESRDDIAIKQSRLNKFKSPNSHSNDARDLLSPFLLRYL